MCRLREESVDQLRVVEDGEARVLDIGLICLLEASGRRTNKSGGRRLDAQRRATCDRWRGLEAHSGLTVAGSARPTLLKRVPNVETCRMPWLQSMSNATTVPSGSVGAWFAVSECVTVRFEVLCDPRETNPRAVICV